MSGREWVEKPHPFAAELFSLKFARKGSAPAGCRQDRESRQMDENELQKEFIDKGLTAPRITPADIDRAIIAEAYYVFPGTTLTVVCLTLLNGFTVVGESACASPENFNAEIGRKLAREHARNKIWQLEGYRLRSALASSLAAA